MGTKEFVLYDVCKECNEKLGAKVDNYLTDYIIIKIIRKSLGLSGKENKEVKVFPATLQDVTGKKYLIRNDAPTIAPLVNQYGNILNVEADTLENGKKIARIKLKKLGKTENEINAILNNVSVGEIKRYMPQFNIHADINIGRYLLAGIKIACEYAYKTLGDKYFEDEVSIQLRRW